MSNTEWTIATSNNTDACWIDYPDWSKQTSANYYQWYPYYDNSKITELEARIEELEEMLELLEKKTGYEVVEEPRFKVRKKR